MKVESEAQQHFLTLAVDFLNDISRPKANEYRKENSRQRFRGREAAAGWCNVSGRRIMK